MGFTQREVRRDFVMKVSRRGNAHVLLALLRSGRKKSWGVLKRGGLKSGEIGIASPKLVSISFSYVTRPRSYSDPYFTALPALPPPLAPSRHVTEPLPPPPPPLASPRISIIICVQEDWTADRRRCQEDGIYKLQPTVDIPN